MTSLKTYKTNIKIEKNLLIDNISQYISTLTPVINTTIQYQKIDLDLYIKVDSNQSNLVNGNLGNYAVIKQDNKDYYYFITEATWISESCVMLKMSIDSINTFYDKLTFTSKTQITRQHKPRFKNKQFTTSGMQVLNNLIDHRSEGISANKYKTSDVEVIDTQTPRLNQHWYLIYMLRNQITTESTSVPIDVYLVPENTTPVSSSTSLLKMSEIDRTNYKLVMMIECPYVVKSISWNNDDIVLPSGWTTTIVSDLSNSKYVINIPSTNEDFRFQLSESTAVASMLSTEFKTFVNPRSIDEYKHMLKLKQYETKLYHSDFHEAKIAYDTYAMNIRCEDITYGGTGVPVPQIVYCQSNNLNSNLAFKVQPGNYTYDEIEDYESYIISTRNNELPILNSDYLNYIRTGYAYDRQKATLSEVSAISSAAGTTALGIGALMKLGASNAAGKNVNKAWISAGVSIVAALVTAVTTTVNTERTLEQTKTEKYTQGASVSNTNDLKLLNFYNGNQLHVFKYNLSEEVSNEVYKLLYYCGYADSTYAVPDLSTRYWFNFIQCEPQFDTTTTEAYSNFLDDISARFQSGITNLHCHNGEYDWEQQYENWESFLFTE